MAPLVAILAIFIALPSMALAANQTISGTLVDNNSAGVAGITVDLERASSGQGTVIDTATTDASGNYSFTDAAQSDYVLEFNPAGATHNPNYADMFHQDEPSFASADQIDTTGGDQTGLNDQIPFVQGTLTGTVSDHQTSAGLSGIGVELLDGSGNVVDNTTTNASGAYTFTENPGTYVVEFAPNGDRDYLTQYYNGASTQAAATAVTVTGGSATANINASLTLASAHVTGTVTNASGTPLANIAVQAPDSNGNPISTTTTTASDGTYTLTGLPTGTIAVRFSGNGQNYVSQYYNGKSGFSSADQFAVTSGTTTPNINAKLATGGILTGTVTNAAGTPLQGAQVQVLNCVDFAFNFNANCTATTDATGKYTIQGLATGNFFLQFSEGTNPNLLTVYSGGSLNADQAAPVSVTAGSTTTLGAALPTGGQITGTITNASGGAVVSGVNVFAFDANGNFAGSATTDANGKYTIQSLRGGSYKLEFTGSPALVSEFYNGSSTLQGGTPVGVTQGQTTTISASVPAAASGGRISGTVSGPDGAPLGGAAVTVYDPAGNSVSGATTDSDGTYRTPPLLPGSYKVGFSTPTGNLAFQYYNNQVTIGSANAVAVTGGNTTAGISAKLTTGGSMTGTVTDAASHTALGGIAVYLVDSNGVVLAGTNTLADGTYVLTGVPSGSYHVQFDPQGSTASGGAQYAIQYYNNKATLGSSDAVAITAPNNTPNINAALVTLAGVPTPVTTITKPVPVPTPVPTPTPKPKAGKPGTARATLRGLGKRKATLRFKLTQGKNAPRLKSFSVKLPGGLSFSKKGLKKGVKVAGGGKFSDKISHGQLVVTLKGSAKSALVTIGPKALSVSKKLAKQAKKHKVKSLTVKVKVTDTSKHSTTLQMKFRKPS